MSSAFSSAQLRLIRLYLRRGRRAFRVLPSRETTPKRYQRGGSR